MKPFSEQIEDLCALGYRQAAAQARVAHDAVLLANSKEDVVNILKDIFASRQFMKRLSSARANWLEISPELATNRILSFIESI